MKYKNSKSKLEEQVDDLICKLTIEEKIGFLPTRQGAVDRLSIKAYGVGGEAAHGIVRREEGICGTVFPQPIGLSSTWNKNLMKEIGTAIGDEARIAFDLTGRKGGLTLWAPTIDMERDPRWGRTEEAYGEDPCLTGNLSKELVKGMQGDDEFYLKLVAAPKHFYGNNNEIGRCYCSSSIDPRNKYEYYLRAFKPAFTEAKAASMMTAYNEINGTPAIVNDEVQKIVKDKWGMNGFIVCDGGDMSQTVEMHKYYKTHAETIAYGLKAGIDVFTDDKDLVIEATREALKRNLISEYHLDKALRNIFKIRFRLGEFDEDNKNPYANIDHNLLNCKKHQELTLKAAKESIVLLKNERNLLPLKKEKVKNIAVIGPLSDVVYGDWYGGLYPYKVTPLDGIINKIGKEKVKFEKGNNIVAIRPKNNDKLLTVVENKPSFKLTDISKDSSFKLHNWGFNKITLQSLSNNRFLSFNDKKELSATSKEVFGWFVYEQFGIEYKNEDTLMLKTWNDKTLKLSESTLIEKEDLQVGEDDKFNIEVISNGIEKAVEIAKNSEIAVVFVGNNPVINGKEEIDREDITLPEQQSELIRRVLQVNKNTIVVVVGSYPYALNFEKENVPAILYTSHGSQELGNAIGEIIFGEESPSGRLSMTWYKSKDDLKDIMDYDIITGERTYMYFKKEVLYPFGHGLGYSEIKYENLSLLNLENEIEVLVDIKNIGEYDTYEVVQLYVHKKGSRVKRAIKELKGFEKVHIRKNETKRVKIKFNKEDLEIYDVNKEKMIIEDGEYEILVGRSSQDIKLNAMIHVNGEKIDNRDLSKCTLAINYDHCENTEICEYNKEKYIVKGRKDEAILTFNNVEFKNYRILKMEILSSENCKIIVKKDEAIIGSDSVEYSNEIKTIQVGINPCKGTGNLKLCISKESSIYSLELEK